MANLLKINIHLFWAKQDTDLSKCLTCEEVIYSDMIKAFIQIGNTEDLKFHDTYICLCESCSEAAQIDIINQ